MTATWSVPGNAVVSRVLVAILLTIFATTGWGQQSVSIITGYDYASGDYDQPADFVVRSSPLVIKIDDKEWVAKMQSSYLRIDSIQNGAVKNLEHGQGDTIVSLAKKSWFRMRGIQYFNIGVNLKLPTASEQKGLGTGETDWMVQIDSFRPLGKWMPFGSLGYRWFGDSADSPREDGFFGSVGLHYQYSADLSFGGLLDYRSASTLRVREGKEFIPYAQYRVTNNWTFGLYGVVGISAASPDTGAGLQVVYHSVLRQN